MTDGTTLMKNFHCVIYSYWKPISVHIQFRFPLIIFAKHALFMVYFLVKKTKKQSKNKNKKINLTVKTKKQKKKMNMFVVR